MTFLQPWWLLLGLAVAVPVAIHLFRRRIGRRVDLPTARYLARAEAEHSRDLRLRNVVLMVLRAAAIAFVAIAAARPLVALPGGARGPAALALALDNSMSSGAIAVGVPVLDVFRAAARTTLGRVRPEDRAWLVTADGRVVSGTREELLAGLDSVRPMAGRGDMVRAVALASAAVQESGLSGDIAVLTDAQATQWDQPVNLSGGRVAVLMPAGSPPANNAVTEVEPEPLRWSGGRGAVEAAFISNDSLLYRVAVGGQLVLRGVAEPDARVRAPVVTNTRGWIAGTVEIERDELPADDVRHFAAFSGDPPAVSVLPGSGTYAVTAVGTLVDRGRLVSGRGITLASADLADRLPALLTPPLDPVRVGAANRGLERLAVPWRFGSPVTDSSTVSADSAAFGGALPPTVSLRYRLEQLPGDTSHATDTLALVNGAPWIVAGAGYVIVGSAFDPSHTSLPVSAGFLPWLERTLAHRLSPDAFGVVYAEPSDTISLPSWAGGVEGAMPGLVTSGMRVVFDGPGVHFLTNREIRVGTIVVNPPRSESLVERLSPALMSERFKGAASVLVTTDARKLDRALLAARGKTDVTAAAVAIVGMLLLLEMLVRSNRWRALIP